MTREQLGTIVRNLRKSQGLTVEELAQRSGLGRATIANIESARFAVKLETVNIICKALGAKVVITYNDIEQ